MHSRFTLCGARAVLPTRCKPIGSKLPLGCLLSSTLLLCAGCGAAAGRDYGPPFATLFGVITSSEVQTPSEVRVALVWKKRDPEGNLLRAAQELAVKAEFPVRFRLDVNTLPPAEVMNWRMVNGQLDPSFRYATGTLIVYEDLNGNGALDLLSSDAQTSVDRVLGTPERLSVFYVEGPSAPRTGPGAHAGYNLRREPPTVDPQPGAAVCTPTQVGEREYLPLSAEIPVALTGAPELSREMCERVMPSSSSDGGSGSCAAPTVPQGAQLTCSADGMSYVYKLCQSSGGLCGRVSCDYGCARCSPGDPIPAGWPCH